MPIRVLTWNIGEPAFDTLPAFADAINAVNPDIVLLNEAMRGGLLRGGRDRSFLPVRMFGPDQVATLAQMCGYPYTATSDTAFFGPFGVAGTKINGVMSRTPLSGKFVLPSLEDPPLFVGGRYNALEVQIPINGRTWFIYSLRFSAYNLSNFTRHCALLRDRIMSFSPDTPIIIGGDFNGGAHNHGAFNNTGRTDPSVLTRMPAPIQDLIDQAKLRSVTAAYPLQTDGGGDNLPPYFWATDLILYRGPVAHQNPTDLAPPLPEGSGEPHPYLWVDLVDAAPPVVIPGRPPAFVPAPFVPAPVRPFVNLQPFHTSDPKDQIRTDVIENTSLAFVTFELISTPATSWRKELQIVRPNQQVLTLHTLGSRRSDKVSISMNDLAGSKVILRKQIDIFGGMRTVGDVQISTVAPRSTVRLTWEADR